jgi:uracil-DNA glycosylase family 4
VSDESRHPCPPAARRDLGEWVAYLREIGVREMRVPDLGAARTGAGPGSKRAPSAPPAPLFDGAPRPERAASPPPLLALDDGFDAPPPSDPAARLAAIRRELGDCTRCRLHAARTNIVFGVGSPQARLLFVGEGPGADEDAQGEPFVGRAGKKLDQMIAAIGLQREQVYIANVVKCRPPQNREPERDEVLTCSPFLFAQVEAIRPRVIVTLGAPAARTLLNTKIGITKLRGQWHSFRGIPVMPTFHPAYLLRAYTLQNRSLVFSDLKAARARMDEEP